MKPAFTLIELLVVITIIVVLIALLTPALDQAVYQAELTMCATQHRTVASGVTVYTSDHKRYYPYRPYVTQNDLLLETGSTGGQNNTLHRAWPMNVSLGAPQNPGWDDRPKLAPYFPLNKTLNCPLIDPIDIEDSNDDSIVFGTWNLWYGWQYRVQTSAFNEVFKGMFKMGDRWNWTWVTTPYGDPIDYRSTMLSSTRFRARRSGFLQSASHPAKNDLSFFITKKQDQPEADRNMTYARWDSTNPNSDPIDMNAGYADLSVRRLNDVDWNNDPRTAPIPEFANGADSSYANGWEIVPKE